MMHLTAATTTGLGRRAAEATLPAIDGPRGHADLAGQLGHRLLAALKTRQVTADLIDLLGCVSRHPRSLARGRPINRWVLPGAYDRAPSVAHRVLPGHAGGVRVFSYVVANDGGFAPNPFHGVCTLACCKPKIRASAEVGDLVIGLTKRSERLVYMMLVSEALDFEDYWADPRFEVKKPKRPARTATQFVGDNIY